MKKRGWGIGCMWYGIGNTGHPNPSGAFVEILKDATAILYTGCADIGQGSNTVLAQIAAEELGLDIESITIVSADTARTPDAGATSASRQTYISGNAVKKAVEQANQPIREKAALLLGVDESDLIFKNNKIFSSKSSDNFLLLKDIVLKCREEGRMMIGHGSFNPATTSLDPETGEGVPYAAYAYATQYAEVEVDTETGEVVVLNLIAAHDVGKAINLQMVEGQIEGGCLMGLGYALSEELVVDRGKILNPGYKNYLIPTAGDLPGNLAVHVIESFEESGPFGAKGVGEPALIPTAPAVINAISNALGVRFYECPVTPEKIISALHKANENIVDVKS